MNRASSVPRCAHRHGFTLVEIALCIAIIGFALVAIIGVLPTGMRVQQENREDTLINQDAQYLIEAIRSGVTGPAAGVLLSYVDQVQFGTTNYVRGGGSDQYSNGFELIGLLSRPAVVQRAILRNISGTASDLGLTAIARDFAFTYAVFVELRPDIRQVAVVQPNVWNPVTTNLVRVTNHYDLHLDFRWPVITNPPGTFRTGSGRKVFRTVIAGQLVETNSPDIGAPLYYFRPQNFLP
jgi:prepilin-type N-terminal cleavage/methylation domain-containing protein